MKKLLSILSIVFLFTACAKNNETTISSTNTVKYNFSTNINDTYTVNYIDSIGTTVSIVVTGTSWTKEFANVDINKVKTVGLAVGSTTGKVNTTGNVSIAVDKVSQASSDFTLTTTAPIASVYYVLSLK
jgi:hypothetical protein